MHNKALKLIITVSAAGVMAALALMTRSAGRGPCTRCGYQKDLSF